MAIQQSSFGTNNDGVTIERFVLRNAAGVEAEVITHGATLIALRTPDRAGAFVDVTLGFDALAPYLERHPFFGSTVGRFANRINNATFALDGIRYTLPANQAQHHLHGGPHGFDTRVWHAHIITNGDEPAVEFSYLSPNGEEGYPGNLQVTVRYTLTARNEVRIDYLATTDAPTIVNLTNHTYFNLSGKGSILDHELQIFGSRFLPTDADSIPLGPLQPVAGTPMDFMTPHAIGARIDADDEQLRIGKGYDHCWIFDKAPGELALIARLYDPASGRVMEVETTEPAVQCYTANQIRGRVVGRDGQEYQPRAAVCLETQHYPDSPNRPEYPTTVLRPGETYRQTTIYRFGVQ